MVYFQYSLTICEKYDIFDNVNMKRDYYFDNLKAVLIFLVILGHFLLPIETGPLCILKRWIYSFHMPLFIFVSGYFSKGVYRSGHFRWDKIRLFIGLYILFVTGIQLNYMFLDGNAFDISAYWDQSGAPWYLLCLIYWYLLIPLVNRIGIKKGMLLSVFLSLAAGYTRWIGETLCISRAIVFWPYFLFGYHCKKEHIAFLCRKDVRLVHLVLFIISTFLLFYMAGDFRHELRLIYGNVSYYILGNDYQEGALIRLILMMNAVILSAGIMSLIPQRKLPISSIGENTLPVYILHRIIRDVLSLTGMYAYLPASSLGLLLVFLVAALALTYLLSRKPVDRLFHTVLKAFYLIS